MLSTVTVVEGFVSIVLKSSVHVSVCTLVLTPVHDHETWRFSWLNTGDRHAASSQWAADPTLLLRRRKHYFPMRIVSYIFKIGFRPLTII